MSNVSRVSIPNSVKRTIQNIKEIAGNHSDEEIYAMLKECSMDPNETAQKLLFQDTFHEVKRRRDKRKEGNREAADTKWRPASQGRGGRAGRGNYISRYAYDGGAGRTMGAGKENGISQGRDKDIPFSSHTPFDADYKAASAEKESTDSMSRSVGNMPNEPVKAEHLLTDETSYNAGHSAEETSVAIKKNGFSSVQEKLSLSNTGLGLSSIITIASSAGVYASAPDPVLVPSLDVPDPALLGNINHEVGIRPSAGEAIADRVISHDVGSDLLFSSETSASGKNHSLVNGRVQGNLLEGEGIQVPDTYQPAPSTAILGTSGSRPSSNYNNRLFHAGGPFKAAPAKEWKPKSTNVNSGPNSDTRSTSDVHLNKGEAGESVSCSLPASDSMVSDPSTEVLKLEDLHISDTQHVIIPVHLQVPESERSGLSFGSFDSNFGLGMRLKREPENVKYLEEPSDSSGEHEENVDQYPSSDRDDFPVAQEKSFSDDPQEMPEAHISSVSDISSNISPAADYDQSKAGVYVATEGSQRSVIHTAPVYSNFGFVPQMLGSPFATFDGAELQARDAGRLPSFVVQQPFDPSSNYYASIYRPTADGDGRFSPFLAPGTAPKYNGNFAVLPSQNSQSQQESVNSLVLPSTIPTPTVIQTTGVVQTSVAAGQQPVPVFRQPAGVHISHYPPNYAPYNQYISPFYIPPPAAIHHFLGNASVFPQQAPTGSLYPPPAASAGTTPVKYPISQYKHAGNTGPTGQGTYVVNPAAYNSAVSGGNSTGSEDLSTSQFKENNVFITGQQSEGSAVWISPAGRDITAIQAGHFYNVSPHGQPVAYAPTQAGHAAAFTGVYHPTQSVATGSVHPLLQQSQAMVGASEMVGPPAGVYQQPQRSSQINWFNNF